VHPTRNILTKVTRTGSRGTSSKEVDTDEIDNNFAGDSFKEYQKKKAEEHPDAQVTTNRGTGSTEVGDIPETETPGDDTKSKVQNRGTHKHSDDCNC
tara:strand:+ start:3784 stop:4074 length:291 start_codon:yes stop_codon:yes gene_type:complete